MNNNLNLRPAGADSLRKSPRKGFDMGSRVKLGSIINIPVPKKSPEGVVEKFNPKAIDKQEAKKEPKSIFQKSNEGIPRRELREVLEKMNWDANIKMSRTERVAAERDLFDPKKYGHYSISTRDIESRLGKLRAEQAQAAKKNPSERIKYQRKINLLNKLKGMKA